MGLNSSGQISLAGTTVGQSIELELGGNGSTTISLNDTTVRGLAAVPSGTISFSNFWGKSNISYWGQIINHSTYSSASYSIASDSDKNVYVASAVFNGTINMCLVVKYDGSGIIQWQKIIGEYGNSYGNSTGKIKYHTDGYLYVAIGQILSKISTSGVISWQNMFTGIILDFEVKNSSIYLIANQSLIKLNLSGNTIFNVNLTWSGPYNYDHYNYPYSLCLDPSENIYIGCMLQGRNNQARGRTTGIVYYYWVGISKYNSSGGVVWSKYLNNFQADRSPGALRYDSYDGYVYFYTYSYGMQKISTDGNTIVNLPLTPAYHNPRSSVRDASNNLYVDVGYTGIAKYNSSNVLQWAKYIGSYTTSYSNNRTGLYVDSNSLYNTGAMLTYNVATGGTTRYGSPAYNQIYGGISIKLPLNPTDQSIFVSAPNIQNSDLSIAPATFTGQATAATLSTTTVGTTTTNTTISAYTYSPVGMETYGFSSYKYNIL